MDLEINEAARRLGVTDSRVRQLLRAKTIRGRRVGNAWLVAAEDIARLESHRIRAGRPLAPRRAWAALDLLNAGQAPWVSASARSQVRSHLDRLEQPAPEVWLSLLRGRHSVIHASAHPAALRKLAQADRVLRTGVHLAAQRDFDLVALTGGDPEFYVEASAWPHVAQALDIRESWEPNVLIRVPREVWPFKDDEGLSDPALAADLLESAEPRAVAAGAARLNELLAHWQGERRRDGVPRSPDVRT